jgi:hypothetical protein
MRPRIGLNDFSHSVRCVVNFGQCEVIKDSIGNNTLNASSRHHSRQMRRDPIHGPRTGQWLSAGKPAGGRALPR